MEVVLEDSLENGGRAIKLIFKELKVPKLYIESVLVRMVFLSKNKGDINYVDCNVTG